MEIKKLTEEELKNLTEEEWQKMIDSRPKDEYTKKVLKFLKEAPDSEMYVSIPRHKKTVFGVKFLNTVINFLTKRGK